MPLRTNPSLHLRAWPAFSRPAGLLCSCAVAALALGLPANAMAGAKLEVQYVDAEKFVDIGFGSIERERNLKTLSDFLQTQADKLPEGQTLQLTVTDVDLAGQVWPGSVHEIRVLRGRADWPRIQLRYTLSQGGQTLKSGEAQVSDMNYLDHAGPMADSLGALGHEKRMLQSWFRKTFIDPQP